MRGEIWDLGWIQDKILSHIAYRTSQISYEVSANHYPIPNTRTLKSETGNQFTLLMYSVNQNPILLLSKWESEDGFWSGQDIA